MVNKKYKIHRMIRQIHNRLITAAILFLLCFVGMDCFSQTVNTNNYILNFPIKASYEDTSELKGNVYSIKWYETVEPDRIEKNAKVINGKKFNLKSYTEYLPDGRKRYKEYLYGDKMRYDKYYYDEAFKNLILEQNIGDGTMSKWLFYDEDKRLNEEIDYKISDAKEFAFWGYTKYEKEISSDATIIRVKEYGYDSLPDPDDVYIFTPSKLTIRMPLYQSKVQTFKKINGMFKPDSIYRFVFDDRNINFEHDDNGYLVSETWIKAGQLENKTEYFYDNDYRTVIKQDYHRRGTERSTRNTKNYDANGNIIFDQSIYYDGSIGSITLYEYKYDEKRNWTERKKFNQEFDKGLPAKKQLVSHEIREITYYQPGQRPRELKLPTFATEAINIPATIPGIAAGKQKVVDDFHKAVETGDFDVDIKIKSAKTIEEFTPKHWKLKEIVQGNLDNNEADEEIAAVYETPVGGDDDFDQHLAIYKKRGDRWTLWHQTSAPLLSTQSGGLMGNPFSGIKIERRCIVIDHFGGSRIKWNYTHRYRFQNNNWYVIGATINFGAPCDYFTDLDYNMVTGDVIASNTTEDCDENDEPTTTEWKERFKHKKPLILMDNFTPGTNEMKVGKQKEPIYY